MAKKMRASLTQSAGLSKKGTCDFTEGSDCAEKIKFADCIADLSGR
jgi:hypothetical protein